MPSARLTQVLLLAALIAPAWVLAARQIARKDTARPSVPALPEPPRRTGEVRGVGAEMQNVDFHIDSGIVLRILRLRGELVPTKAGEPPKLDDKLSFTLSIRTAQISIDTVSLATLLNRHVFGYAGSPLKKLHVSVDGDQLVQTGVMHKVVDMPFRIRAIMTLTPAGQIRLHPTAIRVMGMNPSGLMRFFHASLGGLITLQPGHGASIEKDDFILDPEGMLPPPAMRGRLTAVGLSDGRLLQTFGTATGADATPTHRPRSAAPNFMYFHGGTLRFGKLSMANSDLEIVDNDPSNPFDYDPDRYSDHLVAGWSQTTEAAGLIVHMPDLKMLPRRMAAKP